MTYISISVLAILTGVAVLAAKNKMQVSSELDFEATSIYDFKVEDIKGQDFDLASLKGKKVIIVNTASKCGLTPQFEGLQELYENYKDKNLAIIGFPTNDFMRQDPGTNESIASFCSLNYGVTFPMMAKIKVKGSDMHPLYTYLTQKKYNGYQDSSVKWNFQKYLINEEGKLEKIISPKVSPTDKSVISWIEG